MSTLIPCPVDRDDIVHGLILVYIDLQLPVHSKNSRVRFDPEKGPMGPDPFLGQTDLESG